MRGTIVKGIAGFYYVKIGSQVYQCKARGIFKKEGIVPAVGDQVEVELIPGSDGIIDEIITRKNSFVRPSVANVDCFVIVVAMVEPAPNLTILDRFLVMAEKSQTGIILCINKIDLVHATEVERVQKIYDGIYPVITLSGITGQGIDALRAMLPKGRVALAGPSGVGKSTILNRLAPEVQAETGDISRKTKRGKHTTRHAELFDIGDGASLFDTPGFTSFEILEAEEGELQFMYPEMVDFLSHCKYDNCRHIKEPGCSVREAVGDGKINSSRYASYLAQLREIQEANKF